MATGDFRSGISVVIPAYQAERTIARALAPVMAMLRAGVLRDVIVVDDASRDATAQIARECGAEVIQLARNSGPATARNRAARVARGDILWFVDADVVVEPTGPALISAALRDPRVGAVFGSYDATPDDPHWFSRYKNLSHRYYHRRAAPDAQTFWSGCGAIRACVFNDVGGFDGAQFPRPTIEDIELGYRIAHAGHGVRIEPALSCKHLKVWRFGNALRTDIFDRAIPWSRLILTREGLSDHLNIDRAERARAALAWALLASLLVTCLTRAVWPVPLGLLAAAVVANQALLRALWREGGPRVALGGILFHQLYYLYASAAFVGCALWLKVPCNTVLGRVLTRDRATDPQDPS